MPILINNTSGFQRIKFFYLFILVIFSGLATTFYVSKTGLVSLFLLTFIFALSQKVQYTIKFLRVLFFTLSFFLLQAIATNSFYPFYIFRNLAFVYITYIVFVLYRKDFFSYLEGILFFLCTISLFFWSWEILHPSSIIYIFSKINISSDLFVDRPFYYNFFFYTVDYDSSISIQRNSGFCWEPGPFSIYAIIGLFIYLSQIKKVDSKIIIYLLTIVSTLSTTGFLALGVLLFFVVLRKMVGPLKYIIAFTILVLFVFLFFTLPFMYSKISELFYTGIDVEYNYIKISRETGYSYSSGRFGGIIIGLRDLLDYPFFGIGSNAEWSFANENFATVKNVSGLGSIASTYGGIGLFIFIYSFFKSSFYNNLLLYKRKSFDLVFIYIISFFSFNFQTQPIIFVFLFYFIFSNYFSTVRISS